MEGRLEAGFLCPALRLRGVVGAGDVKWEGSIKGLPSPSTLELWNSSPDPPISSSLEKIEGLREEARVCARWVSLSACCVSDLRT